MMHRLAKPLIMFLNILSLCLLPAVHGYGAECLEPSPTIEAGRDPYAPVRVRDLSPAEQAEVKALLLSLHGEWHGSATDMNCWGFNDPEDKEINHFTAKAKVEVDRYGNFKIRVDLKSREKRTSHQEVLRLYLEQDKLRYNSTSGYGDVELITASSHAIAFVYRWVLALDRNRGTSRKERFVRLELNGIDFTVGQRIYSQGRLSYQQQWRLSRYR